MSWLDGGWKWPVLGLILFLVTFGSFGLLCISYVLCIIAGGLVIAFYHGRQLSITSLQSGNIDLCRSRSGVLKVMKCMESMTRIKNFDRRMTGASVIDEALQEVLGCAMRDYIKSWYRQVSDHDGYLLDIRQCVQKIAITFASRSKDVDWMPYFTQRLVDDFASHIRLYRRARERVKISPRDEDYEKEIETAFFDLEYNMEKMCRDLVSISPEDERQYLQDLSEVLLYLLLPTEDFQNKTFRYILREVLVNGILMPTVDLMSDPDYMNQNMSWLCKETTFSNETFLNVLKSSDNIAELEAVKEITEQNIAKWRSQDSGGSDDSVVKQNLNSLLFVKSICEGRIKRIEVGGEDPELCQDISEFCRAKNIFVLSLDEIIENNIALAVFIEFMSSVGGQQYLFFYLNVEGFRAAAEQQISAAHQQAMGGTAIEADLESLRRAAMIIHDQYLSDKATSKIRIEADIIKRTLQKIKTKNLSEDVFDEAQAKVYQILHGDQYYENFLQSNVYMKLLQELGLMPDSKSEDGDNLSLDDVPRIIWFKVNLTDDYSCDNQEDGIGVGDTLMSAYISQTGIVKESDKSGKSYAVFAIRVTRKEQDDEDIQEVYRRYSDFHDLNMLVQEKFPELQGPHLPGKTVLKQMNKEFLEKRRKALDNYLQTLLNKELWEQYHGLKELVLKFLAPGLWEKHKSELARKMDTIVNPLRTSVKRVVSTDASIVDGLGKFMKGEGSVPGDNRRGQDSKVGANIDLEGDENIPLRIMLLLMDEVIDLRQKNQWLRRRIVAILRQLIKAAFGDRINKKIVEHVDLMTSAEQMAEYVKTFRDSFWPGGVLTEPRPPRSLHTKMRTRVACKAKMLGSAPDEMRTLMGTETIKLGVTRIFDMFQYKGLNKRLVYVCLEGVVQTLFPENKFVELFEKLHSRSNRKFTKNFADKSETDPVLRKRPVRR
ncbi:sorting nexin-13-like isoform X2 [Mizuhopecten yessoensis]|uniref:sorting nexin-13-like isoform X2 n=1 Tax=Mizuhopecten yessoensis TaxID=6573 RepID=UPI000B4591EE|nr:sorting nexin-13-like isoform X2 [Mizuhopecten yessoensis]